MYCPRMVPSSVQSHYCTNVIPYTAHLSTAVSHSCQGNFSLRLSAPSQGHPKAPFISSCYFSTSLEGEATVDLPRFEEGFQHTADAASCAQIPGGLACRFSSSSCMKALVEIGLPWERLSNQSAEYHLLCRPPSPQHVELFT